MHTPKLDTLTEKQRQFVLEYLQNGFNATRAALAAGYSEPSAYSIGSENLKKPEVVAAVAEQMDRLGLTPAKLKAALGEIALTDMADFEDLLAGGTLKEGRENGVATAAIKKLKSRFEVDQGNVDQDGNPRRYEIREIELYDRLTAIEKLLKVYGLMLDVQKVESNLKMYGVEAPVDLV